MGKTYLETTKYMIIANFEIDGLVEKPDVIGAIFGQSEGLLGADLDLKELQQNGKIGRIEITINHKDNKTQGELKLPCSLSMTETALIAAAIETIDKVGPCDVTFKINQIEDTRSVKRNQIKERAVDLLTKVVGHEIPDTKELINDISSSIKVKEIIFYGPDKLPAGPDIDNTDELIVVEGRADVLNMLKYGFTNVISTNGARIPPSLAEICKSKKVTVFLDGDRGGDIQLEQLKKSIKIDYVAKAPDGKEVEELTQKEINQALRRKIKLDYYYNNKFQKSEVASKTYHVQPSYTSNPQNKFGNSHKQDSYKGITENKFKVYTSASNKSVEDLNFLNMLADIPNVEKIDATDSRNKFSQGGSSFKNNQHRDFNSKSKFSNNRKYNNNFKQKEAVGAIAQKQTITPIPKLPNTGISNELASEIINQIQEIKNNINTEKPTEKPIVLEIVLEQKKQEKSKEDVFSKDSQKDVIKGNTLNEEQKRNLLKTLDDVIFQKESVILNNNFKKIASASGERFIKKLKNFKENKVYVIVTDQELTEDLLKIAKEKKITFIVCPDTQIKSDKNIQILTKNDLKK